MVIFERLVGSAHAATGKLRVRSALNPFLWLSGIVGLACLSLSVIARDGSVLSFLLLGTGMTTVLTACGVGVYLAIWRPEKLQSEEYQLRQQAMEIIKESGSKRAISAASLEKIANPILPEVPLLRELPGGSQE